MPGKALEGRTKGEKAQAFQPWEHLYTSPAAEACQVVVWPLRERDSWCWTRGVGVSLLDYIEQGCSVCHLWCHQGLTCSGTAAYKEYKLDLYFSKSMCQYNFCFTDELIALFIDWWSMFECYFSENVSSACMFLGLWGMFGMNLYFSLSHLSLIKTPQNALFQSTVFIWILKVSFAPEYSKLKLYSWQESCLTRFWGKCCCHWL